jgi:hypothetical protein
MGKVRIYLDDIRTPIEKHWIVVRNYDQFVTQVRLNGLENIETISFDHDLGETAMEEYYNNVSPNYKLNYENILEKTGMDCAKWLVDHYYDNYYINEELFSRASKKIMGITFPQIYVHSANPIGSANIMGYINNFLMNEAQSQSCVRVQIAHSV